MPTRNPAALVVRKTEFLNSRSGRIGSAARFSCAAKSASSADAQRRTRRRSATSSSGYSVPPQTVPSRIAVTPATSSPAPRKSILCSTRRKGSRKHDGGHDKRDDAERDVDVEAPAPGEVLGEQAADRRSGDARDREHRHAVGLVLASVARREDVAGDRHRERHDPAGAEALDGAAGDQLDHRVREPGQHRSDEEDADRASGRRSSCRRGRRACRRAASSSSRRAGRR